MASVREERPVIEAPGGSMPGYLAAPESWPPGPAAVVVQEWWGLNDNIEGICRRLAGDGYAALAPDLYRGKQPGEPDEARKLAMELDRAQAMEDLMGAVTFLFDADAEAVGAIGFCMGGSLVWELTCEDERLSAAVPFYGFADIRERELHAPVMAHFGTEDRFTPEQLEDLRRQLDDHDRYAHALYLYDGAPHAFMNDSRPSYRADAAALAWERTLSFFANHLGAPIH